jgi:hypothetical protein
MSTKERITLKNTNRLLDPFLFGLGLPFCFTFEWSKTFSSVEGLSKTEFFKRVPLLSDRVARFFLIQYTKMVKNMPNYH